MCKLVSNWIRPTALLVLMAATASLYSAMSAKAQNGNDSNDKDGSRIRMGYDLAPVQLDVAGLNPDLVGLGSYILNAQIGCNDCHTWPNYAPGGNPFLGQPEQINTAHYMGGGRPFPNGIVSPNISPDPVTGLPAGLTLDEFMSVMRTGVHPDNPNRLLQVMPWPQYRNMRDRDLEAIYEYLSAIPSVP
jgi:hypothetical protein